MILILLGSLGPKEVLGGLYATPLQEAVGSLWGLQGSVCLTDGGTPS